MTAGEQDELFDALTCDPMELIERLGDEVDARIWPERLHLLFELHRNYNVKRVGWDEARATLDARDRCILLGEYLGGRQFIIPRGDAIRRALRDKLMWHQFTGRNYDELAERYGLSLMQVYRIMAEQKKLHASQYQGELFAGND